MTEEVCLVGAEEGDVLRNIDGELIVGFNVGGLELGLEVVTGGLVGILVAGIKKSTEYFKAITGLFAVSNGRLSFHDSVNFDAVKFVMIDSKELNPDL